MSNDNPFETPTLWRDFVPLVRVVTWLGPVALWTLAVLFFGLGTVALFVHDEFAGALWTAAIAMAFLVSPPTAYRSARNEGDAVDAAVACAWRALRTCAAAVFNVSLLIALVWKVCQFVAWFFV